MSDSAKDFLKRLINEARESLLLEYTGQVTQQSQQMQSYLDNYDDGEDFDYSQDEDFDDDFGDKDEQTYIGKEKRGSRIYWYPKVFYSYVQPVDGEDCYIMDIAWLPEQVTYYLVQIWNKKYGDIFTSKLIPSKLKAEPRKRVECTIPVAGVQKFLEILPEALNDIGVMGGGKKNVWFGEDALSNLSMYIKDRLASTPNRQEFMATRMKIRRMADFVTDHLDDPRVVQALQKITGKYYDRVSPSAQKAKGHELSPENKVQIYAQMPDATFVTQEWCWRTYFNREVLDKNKYAIILKPRKDLEPSPEAMEKACQKCGYKDYAEYVSMSPKLSPQERGVVMMWYGILNNDPTSFLSIKVYDVSNTRLFEGATDTFRTEAGLENNLLGIPNNSAINQDRQLAAQQGGDYIPGGIQTVGDEVVLRLRTVVRTLLARKDILMKPSGDPEKDIYFLGYTYAYDRISESDVDPEPYCRTFASLVLASFGYTPAYGTDFFAWLRSKNVGEYTIDAWRDTLAGEYRKFMGLVAKEINRVNQGNATVRAKKEKAKKNAELQPTGTDDAIAGQVNEGVGGNVTPRVLSDQEIDNIVGLADQTQRTPEAMLENFNRLLDGMEMIGR